MALCQSAGLCVCVCVVVCISLWLSLSVLSVWAPAFITVHPGWFKYSGVPMIPVHPCVCVSLLVALHASSSLCVQASALDRARWRENLSGGEMNCMRKNWIRLQ